MRGRGSFCPAAGAILFVAATAGCAAAPPAPAGERTPAAAEGAATPRQEAQPVPPGYGTLRQDDITMSLRDGPLLIKVTPLAESVIRLVAPDTYDRLHALAESRRTEAEQAALDRPELYLVSFFSYEPDVAFTAEDLQLTHQGKLMRSVRIMPVTSGFGRQRLAQQESQTAIYVFDERIDYEQPIVARYALIENRDWSNIIQQLEVERAKVRARVR